MVWELCRYCRRRHVRFLPLAASPTILGCPPPPTFRGPVLSARQSSLPAATTTSTAGICKSTPGSISARTAAGVRPRPSVPMTPPLPRMRILLCAHFAAGRGKSERTLSWLAGTPLGRGWVFGYDLLRSPQTKLLKTAEDCPHTHHAAHRQEDYSATKGVG